MQCKTCVLARGREQLLHTALNGIVSYLAALGANLDLAAGAKARSGTEKDEKNRKRDGRKGRKGKKGTGWFSVESHEEREERDRLVFG